MYPCAWWIIQPDFSDFPTTEKQENTINQKFYGTEKKQLKAHVAQHNFWNDN